MYTYLNSEPSLWTTGYYAPDGEWMPEMDTNKKGYAAARVAWLNGSGSEEPKEEQY